LDQIADTRQHSPTSRNQKLLSSAIGGLLFMAAKIKGLEEIFVHKFFDSAK